MKLYAIYFFILTLSTTSLAQHTQHNIEGTHQFKRFRISINIGHCYIPKAEFSNDEQLVVLPTWGLDFQFWFSQKVGIGLKNDIENASYRVRYRSGSLDELFRERPIIRSLPFFYTPWNNGLNFMMGPGIELDESANLFVLRVGISYDFELGHHWDFAPEFIYDHKGTSINAFTLSVGVGKRF